MGAAEALRLAETAVRRELGGETSGHLGLELVDQPRAQRRRDPRYAPGASCKRRGQTRSRRELQASWASGHGLEASREAYSVALARAFAQVGQTE